ncbi:MAG TPA: hypothetical protein VIE89_29130 [Candidatus Binatia bacterium]
MVIVKAPMKIRSGWPFIFFSVLFASLFGQTMPAKAQLKGTATYRERTALTPEAVFEAILDGLPAPIRRATTGLCSGKRP